MPAIRDICNDAILRTTAAYRYQPVSLEERLGWFDEKTAGVGVMPDRWLDLVLMELVLDS